MALMPLKAKRDMSFFQSPGRYIVLVALALALLFFTRSSPQVSKEGVKDSSKKPTESKESESEPKISLPPALKEWTQYNRAGFFPVTEYPSCLRLKSWPMPQRAPEFHGRNAFAFALTALKSEKWVDIAVEKAAEIRMYSQATIIFIIYKYGLGGDEFLKQLEAGLKALGSCEVVLVDLPFQRSDLPARFVKIQDNNPNCCGITEYIKFHAFNLPYDTVILLDLDISVLKPIHHLFDCHHDLMYSPGPASPLNGGMLVLKGNQKNPTEDIVADLIYQSQFYNNDECWGGTGCGPCAKTNKKGVHCYGSEGLQGYLHYYFVKRRAANCTALKLNMCVYDAQIKAKTFDDMCLTSSMPYMVHKWSPRVRQNVEHDGLSISLQPKSKVCRPDFWIIGAEKSGTISLNAFLARHPQVFSVSLSDMANSQQQAPSPRQDLSQYNAQFSSAPADGLVGDAAPSRLVDGVEDIVTSCGHRFSKFFVLLRDPLERCIAEVAKSEVKKTSSSSRAEVSAAVEKQLDAFERKLKKNAESDWPESPLPQKLFGSGENCVYDGIYVMHLKRLQYFTSVDNVRLYFTRDFSRAPNAVLMDAIQFLSLPVDGWEMPARFDDVVDAIPPLDKVLSSATEQRFRKVMQQYDSMLEELLGRRLPWQQ